ncbi:uncharacterized protein LOC143295347 isoform X2 [Babylonia areolata]
MDGREMTSGVIPLRHCSLPGHIKLPRRYEKAAMGTSGIPARMRKISIQPGQSALGGSLSDRLDDLMTAFMWVKQELIMLRQHDILLKRQFFNIRDSIHTLQKPSLASTSTSSSASATTTSPATCATTRSTASCETSSISSGCGGTVGRHSQGTGAADEGSGVQFSMDTFFVRQACSVTMLHDGSQRQEEEEEDADIFADQFFRGRTSSMRTSRDMAALARRRGSKELI